MQQLSESLRLANERGSNAKLDDELLTAFMPRQQ